MTKLAAVALAAMLAIFAACSKGNQAQEPAPSQVAYGQTYQAPPSQSVWDQAWDGITAGAEEVADAGEWTLHKAKDGAIVAWRGTKRVAGSAAEEVNDTAVLANVKTRLAAAEGVPASNIVVQVDEGVVTLRGNAGTPEAASKAVRETLSTRGVERVVSYLTW